MQNRQNGRRRRGGGNNPRPMGQPMGGQANASRLEVRVRGNAHQLLEKYKVMARDAHQAGDRVAAEYYLQHADHYFRVLNDSRIRQDEMRARRGAFDGLDDETDGEDAGDDMGEREPEARDERMVRQDRRDRDRPERSERSERDRPERSERGPRVQRPVEDREQGPVRRDRAGADDMPPRRERGERMNGDTAEPVAMSDGEAALAAFGGVPAAVVAAEAAPAPKRRGRPRKVAVQPEAEPATDG